MGLACLIAGDVDKVTDESKWSSYPGKLQKSELECFHKALEQRAYFAAEWDYFREKPEVYWRAAKASVALEIVGELDAMTSPRFKPSEAILPLDYEDAELIYSVMRFPGIQRNLHTTVNGEVKDYICDGWHGWLKIKKEPESE